MEGRVPGGERRGRCAFGLAVLASVPCQGKIVRCQKLNPAVTGT
ncbi:hypothetical protein LptCag_1242 [Leptospirillum ferriphilum]|uniref:Uncharacterized protein n=1 Tax=Leptospirillum ferriphilum TaxID=178606 RepID=A0A094X7J3_9BACT|nr:hypothetical protein LptCag_1242 [Leptospirillum ferriphilum]